MDQPYDAIVVGARCAGSPSAMLLARMGYRVLLVDSATFPSDTVSTHIVQPRGVEALARWGLLERLVATGCPPIHTYSFDFGPITIEGAPGNPDYPLAYCPRRTVLDALLVAAAQEAGAELREAFTVDELLFEEGRVAGIRGHARGAGAVTERARVVIGADGRSSLVARAVKASEYNQKPPLLVAYYAYFSGLPMNGRFETFVRPERGFAAAPTNDDLTLIIAGWPYSQLAANRGDIEGHYQRTLELAPPHFVERLRGATRVSRLVGTGVRNYFRTPYGPGWALVGDAGYDKDFITAQGISDAFRDAELCARALDQAFRGARSFDAALAEYQSERDRAVLPMYEMTCQLATLEPPPPEMQRLLAAIQGDREAMDNFARMNAGTLSPAAFFSSPAVGARLAQAGAH